MKRSLSAPLGPVCLEETRTDLIVTNVCNMVALQGHWSFFSTWVEGFALPCSA